MNLSRLLIAAALAGAARGAAPAPPPTVITSDQFESHSTDTETFWHFTSHVVVTGNDLKMDCDTLDVTTTRVEDNTDTIGKQDAFKHLIAVGHVRIVQGDREATCGRAEVLPRDNKIILTENPVVTDHGNGSVATGEVIALLRDERMVTGTHVRITGPPVKDLGFDKSLPPPAPDRPPAGQPSPK
jgi:lipopolysaccharide export system protein LptA